MQFRGILATEFVSAILSDDVDGCGDVLACSFQLFYVARSRCPANVGS